MRTCPECGETKPITEWHHARGVPNSRLCKTCHAARRRRPAPPAKTSKRCPMCQVTKPIAAFRQERRQGRLDLGGYCLECEGHASRARRYGITPAEFQAMIDRQAGCCLICDQPMGKPYVDHDHETGKVRGLLCHHCNSGIGMLGEDPDRLLSAAAYLLAHRDVLGVVV